MLAGGLEWADPTDLVGDRLATDVRLAKRAGMAGALILTGATTLGEALDEALDSGDEPDYIIEDLGELLPSEDETDAAAQAGVE